MSRRISALALEGSSKRQRQIATAFLEKSDHRFLHKELAARLGVPQVTLNGEFGKLAHRVYTMLGRPPVDQQEPSQWCSELVEFKWSADGWIWIAQERFIDALERIFMDEVETGNIHTETFFEGRRTQREITVFERSRSAREACLKEFGRRCFICKFDFGKTYGSRFATKIHVHHLEPVASRRTMHELDAKRDLRPVCPNCHYVLHLKDPPYTVTQVQHFFRNSQKNTKAVMTEKVRL
jgi:5-methylcytosine-specific restriction protein A